MQIDKSIVKPVVGKGKQIARSYTPLPRLGIKSRFVTQSIPGTAASGKPPQTVYHTVVIPTIANTTTNTTLSVSTNLPHPATASSAICTPTPASNSIISLSAIPRRFESSFYDEPDTISTASSSITSVPVTLTTSTNPNITVINKPKRVADTPETAAQQISTSFPQVSNDTVSI